VILYKEKGGGDQKKAEDTNQAGEEGIGDAQTLSSPLAVGNEHNRQELLGFYHFSSEINYKSF